MWDWTGYLDLARTLHATESAGESEYRCAVSRAYYAAFHEAHHWLESNDPTFSQTGSGQDHEVVWRAHEVSPDQRRKDIALQGRRLRRLRNVADYRAVMPKPQREARRCVKRATEVLDLLNQL